MTFEVRRAADRFTTDAEGRSTRHSFSFDRHYDPANVAHALLVAHNDDRLAPGGGYPTHPHRDTEIVTWVLDGSLVHEDSTGHRGETVPGLVQAMTAGTGVLHSERNDASSGTPTRFVQMWLRPDEPDLVPSYSRADADALLVTGGLVPVASGAATGAGADAPVRIAASAATLHVARPAAGAMLRLPDAPYVHLFVTRGSVEVEGVGRLTEADAVRFTGDGERTLTAEPGGSDGSYGEGAEVLVWEMHRR